MFREHTNIHDTMGHGSTIRVRSLWFRHNWQKVPCERAWKSFIRKISIRYHLAFLFMTYSIPFTFILFSSIRFSSILYIIHLLVICHLISFIQTNDHQTHFFSCLLLCPLGEGVKWVSEWVSDLPHTFLTTNLNKLTALLNICVFRVNTSSIDR